jgi:TatA/E family protein of Tat protein translocase
MQTPFILFLGDIGGSEVMLIMVVILIFFGANKIPELARGLGKGIREFKDASKVEDTQQPQYRDQPGAPVQPPYQQQYPQQGAPQQGYQQQAPPIFNPNDPNNQPR